MKTSVIALSTLAAVPYASATFGASASANFDFGAFPSCAHDCFTQSVSLVKCALTDFKCLCSNQKFLETVNTCVAGPCGDADKTKVLSLAMNFCNSVGIRLPNIGLNLGLNGGLNGGLGLNLGGGLSLGGSAGGSASGSGSAGAGKSGYGNSNGYGAASGSGNAGGNKNGDGSGSVSAGLALADQTPSSTVNAVPAVETPADVNIQNSAAETSAAITININSVASAATDVVSSVSAATDVAAVPAATVTVTVTATGPCGAAVTPDVSVLVASQSATMDIAATSFTVDTPTSLETATASIGFVATPAMNETLTTPTTPAIFTGAASAVKGSVAMAVAAGFVAILM